MGAIKEYLWEELLDMQRESCIDDAAWDIFDDYMDKGLEGLPLEEIEEVKSYLDRHYWDLGVSTGQLSTDGEWQKLCEEDWVKRDFLMREMQQKEDNKNIDTLRKGIVNYIKENHMDLLFPDR